MILATTVVNVVCKDMVRCSHSNKGRMIMKLHGDNKMKTERQIKNIVKQARDDSMKADGKSAIDNTPFVLK